eukprot:scaffold66008_cov33-Tisochrysis_lutea.AAC.8
MMSASGTPCSAYSRETSTPPENPQREMPSLRLPATGTTRNSREKKATARGMRSFSRSATLAGVSTCACSHTRPSTSSPSSKQAAPGSKRSASVSMAMRTGAMPSSASAAPARPSCFSGGGP